MVEADTYDGNDPSHDRRTAMKVCTNDECWVHTFLSRENQRLCKACDRPASIIPCPECRGTGVRLVPGNDRTLTCTGCDYVIDLDVEAPAFLHWIEKQTEQSNLSNWGKPASDHLPKNGGWQTAPDGTVAWHLSAARSQLRYASSHALAPFADAQPEQLFTGLFIASVAGGVYDEVADEQQDPRSWWGRWMEDERDDD